MGNYVIAVGNYLIVSPSELGNYKIADTATASASTRHIIRSVRLRICLNSSTRGRAIGRIYGVKLTRTRNRA